MMQANLVEFRIEGKIVRGIQFVDTTMSPPSLGGLTYARAVDLALGAKPEPIIELVQSMAN